MRVRPLTDRAMVTRRLPRWAWLAPVVLAALVYAPAPTGELVWDDPLVIDKQIAAFTSLREVFFPPENIFQWSQNYYRPVVILSYLFDLRVYGDARVAGLHLSNVVFHVLTTLFVMLLARRLFMHLPGGMFGAVIAAAIFAVHPIHTESVSWITGRSDVLAALFLVPAVWLALRWRDSGRLWVLLAMALLLLLALLSKEVAAAGLAMIPLVFWLAPAANQPDDGAKPVAALRSGRGAWLPLLLALIAVTAIYLGMRTVDAVGYGTPIDVGWMNYFVRLEKAAAYYLVKVVIPWPQSNHVAWSLAPGFIATNLAFLIAIGLGLAGFLCLRRYRDGTLLIALAWFVVTLLPSLAVAVRQIAGTPLAERYLYVPSVGMALLCGFFCAQAYWKKWAVPAVWVSAALIVVYSAGTVQRGIVWTDNLSLWTDTTEKVPGHGQPWNLLGITYMEREEYPQALQAFQRAIEGENSPRGRSFAKRNIAVIYHYQNDLARAEENYRAALEEVPDNMEAIHGLGVINMTRAAALDQQNDAGSVGTLLDQAEGQFRQTLSMNPFHAEARWGLAQVLAHQGLWYERKAMSSPAIAKYEASEQEFATLVSRYPAFGARIDVQDRRAGIRAALKRLRN